MNFSLKEYVPLEGLAPKHALLDDHSGAAGAKETNIREGINKLASQVKIRQQHGLWLTPKGRHEESNLNGSIDSRLT